MFAEEVDSRTFQDDTIREHAMVRNRENFSYWRRWYRRDTTGLHDNWIGKRTAGESIIFSLKYWKEVEV